MFSTNKTPNNKNSYFNHFNMDMNNILNHGGIQMISPINYEKFFRIDSFESMQDNELELREQNNNYNNHFNPFNNNNDCQEVKELENEDDNNFNSSNFSVKKKKLSIDMNIVNKSNTNNIFKQNVSNMISDDKKSKNLIFLILFLDENLLNSVINTADTENQENIDV
jgi:hypothetical protein